MDLLTASRKKAKIKIAIQGPSGSGKSMSALLIAFGLCGAWNKISVIDSENRSADLYADLGPYKTLSLEPPYSPERYIEAINVCLVAGMEVIIIDSTTHEWDFLLDFHSSLQGNSFTNWAKVTPRHDAFVNKILQTDAHFICTIRTKQEYVLADKNGKLVPEKVGMKAVQRDNLEYEFTLVFDMDMTHKAKPSKDRTGLYSSKIDFYPTTETGREILKWCNEGSDEGRVTKAETMLNSIKECTTGEQLLKLYYANPQHQETMLSEFSKRRQEILKTNKNAVPVK